MLLAVLLGNALFSHETGLTVTDVIAPTSLFLSRPAWPPNAPYCKPWSLTHIQTFPANNWENELIRLGLADNHCPLANAFSNAPCAFGFGLFDNFASGNVIAWKEICLFVSVLSLHYNVTCTLLFGFGYFRQLGSWCNLRCFILKQFIFTECKMVHYRATDWFARISKLLN